MNKFDSVEEGIINRDVDALRHAVANICYTSRDFSSGDFDETIRYIRSKGIDIIEPELKGNPLISKSKQTYNENDFADAVYELRENFCKERICDVKTIGEKLYGKPEVGKDSQKRPGTDPNEECRQNKTSNLAIIGVAAALVIIVIGLVVLLKD